MRQLAISVPAGREMEIGIVGDYVKIAASPVSMRVSAPDQGEFLDLAEGDSCRLSRFNRISISHGEATDQAVILLVGNGTSSESGRSVVANPTRATAADTHADVEVTNVSGVLLAANGSRRYLFVQNKHATGNVWINLNGAALAAGGADGIKLPPGGFYELPASWSCIGTITAIGDVASNAAVLVVEGS